MTVSSQRIVLSLALCCLPALAACAKGASTLDETANGGAGTTGGTGGATGSGGAGSGLCGNGKVDMAVKEDCDGTLLNNATCETLGFSGGGQLMCDPMTCHYLTTMCHMQTTGGMGGHGM